MTKPPQRPMPKPQSPMNRSRPGGPPGSATGPLSPGQSQLRAPQVPEPPLAGASLRRRPPWYKRKYLVYPKFQLTLIVLNSIVTIVLFILTALLVVRSHIYLEELVRQTRIPAQNLFSQLLTQQLHTLLIYMGVGLVVGVVTTGIATLLLSHKMAGPMIRLRNFFTDISKTGDFPESLNFRDGDFFQDLPPMINQAFNALKRKWHR
ncbi:MAG: hypothetical protein JST80_08050 [Bdellovibrionales bacterium]|nr:hypothetical protein [Bdellovibrionales bacterium]